MNRSNGENIARRYLLRYRIISVTTSRPIQQYTGVKNLYLQYTNIAIGVLCFYTRPLSDACQRNLAQRTRDEQRCIGVAKSHRPIWPFMPAGTPTACIVRRIVFITRAKVTDCTVCFRR